MYDHVVSNSLILGVLCHPIIIIAPCMYNSLLSIGVGHSNAFNWHKETMVHNVLDNNIDYGIYNSVGTSTL